MKVTILRGLPGSGKSTLAKLMGGIIISADDYFTDDKGVYVFYPSNIGEAHNSCLRRFLVALDRENSHVIVDNTNTLIFEVAPYYRLAEAYNYEVEILNVMCDPERAFARQIHNVPSHVFCQMAERMDKAIKDFPQWWIVKVFQT